MRLMNSPDEVCSDAADAGTKISCRLLDDSTVLLEADATGLAFLGRLLLAQASFEKDCGFGIHPRSAGSTFFEPGSTVGLYIHRLPCVDHSLSSHIPPLKQSPAGKRNKRS